MLEKMLLRSRRSMCSSKPGPTTEQELKEFKVLEESSKLLGLLIQTIISYSTGLSSHN